MESNKAQELYEKYGRTFPMDEMSSREERDFYLDYQAARNSGASHEEAMGEHEKLNAHYPKPAPRPQTETDRLYQKLHDSCEATHKML